MNLPNDPFDRFWNGREKVRDVLASPDPHPLRYNFSPGGPLLSQEAIQTAIAEIVRKHEIKCEKLTEQQIADALRQALECGDFQRLISPNGQSVVYIPYSEYERLKSKIVELEARLADLGEDARERDTLDDL